MVMNEDRRTGRRVFDSPFLETEVTEPETPGAGARSDSALETNTPFFDQKEEAELADVSGEADERAPDREEESGLFEALAPHISDADLLKGIDDYFDLANAEYRLPDGTKVHARPQFRYAKAGGIDEAKTRLKRVLGEAFEAKHPRAIHNAVYGRATPREIVAITQALIDANQIDTLSDAAALPRDGQLVRKLQREFDIGIDCAGYVQLAFIHAFTGSDADPSSKRRGLGLDDRRGNERLDSLPASHFTKPDLTDAKAGDLLILKPRAGESDWHTVIVVSHTVNGDEHTFE